MFFKDICDGDIVEKKNLVRQNFVEQDIGRNKAAVLAERYAGAFGIECEYIPEYIESEKRLKRLVAPDFSRQYWNNVPETQKKIEELCLTPEKIPLIDAISEGLYSLPEKESEVPYFRGSIFDTEELAEQFKSSDSLNILFEQSQLESRVRKPLLPLNLSQIGLVGASGLMNRLVDCKHPHVIKGKIVRQKKTSETVNPERDCSELREVESNKMIFNILTPDSYISVS